MKFLLLALLLIPAASYFAQDDELETEKPKSESPLMKAVRAKNLAEVKKLVEGGAPLNEAGRFDFGVDDPLEVAVKNNYQEIAKYLIEKGASSREGLCSAVEVSDAAWIQKLIDYGYKCPDAVLYAVEANKPQTVRMLIERGFKVDFEQKRRTGLFRKHYVSPLGAAIALNSDEMIGDLVKGGADKDQAFQYAVANNRIKLGEHLIDLSDDRNAAFLKCFEYRSILLARYCITKGADKQTVNENGYNAYHFSVRSGYKEGMNYCVSELKLDPFQKTASGQTALMLASASGNLSVFKELFDGHKATLENEDVDGKTALFYALDEDSPAILEYLVSAGANVNHQDKMGNTAVMKAAQLKKPECYFTLKQAKPDLSLKNMNGENVISFLVYSFPGSEQEILEVNTLGASLNVKSTRGQSMAYYAMSVSNMELLTRLKSSGASLDAFDSKGLRPDCSNAEIIRFAVANGCNPNRENAEGDSYLSEALKNNQLELVLFLIRNGADVNWRKRGEEPIIYKAVMDQNLPALQILAENGAKLNVTGRNGESLMDLAEKAGNEDISAYLRLKGAKTKKELAELEILRSKEIAQLDQFIADKDMQQVKALMDKYPDIPLNKTQVSNLAILSVEKSNLPLLQRLIEREGMNINQSLNFQEQNLLHIAAGAGNLDLVRLLVNKGADYKKKDAYDKYPIDYAKSKEVKKYLKSL